MLPVPEMDVAVETCVTEVVAAEGCPVVSSVCIDVALAVVVFNGVVVGTVVAEL